MLSVETGLCVCGIILADTVVRTLYLLWLHISSIILTVVWSTTFPQLKFTDNRKQKPFSVFVKECLQIMES